MSAHIPDLARFIRWALIGKGFIDELLKIVLRLPAQEMPGL
jgi:hypothetical protein